MRLLQTIIESPVFTRLGWVLLHSIWQVAAVALLLALILPVCRKRGARASYAACCAALLLTIVLPAVTFFLVPGQSETGPHSAEMAAALNGNATLEEGSLLREGREAEEIVVERPIHNVGNQSKPHLSDDETPSSNPKVTFAEVLTSFGRQLMASSSAWLPWVVVVWLLGVAVLSVWNVGGWMSVQRLKTRGICGVHLGIQEAAVRMARQMNLKRPVRLFGSTLVDSPLVIGAIKPLILLPASLLCQLPPDQLESLLAHELAHILRQDYLINLLQCAIETLLFYHPAVWWISAQTRVQREYCCDDIAVGVTSDRAVYVKALAAVAGARANSLAPAATGGQLLPRLQRLLGKPTPRTSHPSRWLTGVAALAFFATLVTLLVVRSHTAIAQTTTKPDTDQATQLANAAAQERAIQAVVKAGGQIQRDAKEQGNPVTGVFLGRGQIRMRDKPDVTDTVLEDLKEFKSLKTLHLNGAAVTDAGMEYLKGCKSLQALTLSHTQITDAGLKSLAGLENLQRLDFEDTGLTDAGLPGIKELTSLKNLNLKGTKVTDVGLKELEMLENLQMLSISGGQVTNIGLKALKEFKNLEVLHLYDPKELEPGLKDLAELKSLRNLALSGPRWTDRALKNLDDLRSLQSLVLNETDVTNEGIKILKRLTGLQQLWLSGSLMNDEGLKELKELKNLKTLVLGRLAVTDAGVPHLIAIKSLESLRLNGTNVTSVGLEKLRAALPNCKIEEFGRPPSAPGNRGAPVPSEKQVAAVSSLEKLGGSILGVRSQGRTTALTAHLHGYQVTDAALNDIKELTTLQSLMLDQTSVTDAGLHNLEGLTNLSTLSLDGASVTDAGLKHLKGLSNLLTLSLRNTKVTDAGLNDLKELKNLQGLNLGFTKVTDKGLKELQQSLPQCRILGPGPTASREEVPLRQSGPIGRRMERGTETKQIPVTAEKEAHAVRTVEKLGGHFVRDSNPNGQIIEVDMRGTKVADADLKEIADLSNLRTLYLGNTQVTDAGLKELIRLKNLGFLGLAGVKVSEQMVKELAEALPQCIFMGPPNVGGRRRPPIERFQTPVKAPPKSTGNEPPSVLAIQRLGGKTVRDAKAEGNPVVAISFNTVGVTDADLKYLEEFKGLETIELNGTGITDQGLSELKQFTKLKSLSLVNTSVTDSGLRELREFENLHRLVLEGTRITGAGLRELKSPTNLTSLVLGGAKIADSGLKHLKELKNLEFLRFHFTSVTDDGLEELADLKSLKMIQLGGTQITGPGLRHLKNLANLEFLDLSHAEVADMGLEYLADLTNLRTLHLDHTKVTDVGLVELKKLTNLQRLDLNRTLITDAGLKELKDLKNLRTLNLLNSGVTTSGAKELHKSLPDCQIQAPGGLLGKRES